MASGEGTRRGTMDAQETTAQRKLGCDQSDVTNALSDLQPISYRSYQLPKLFQVKIKRYEGESSDGLYHGKGVAHLQDGHVYQGTFSQGYMHGSGIFKWADGVKYEGEFVASVPMGRGTYIWKDGSCYEGEVCNAIRHGTGTHKCAKTGILYKGQWHQGKRHGKGTIYYNREETSWYKGDWVSNNREGCGERSYPTGNVYTGKWKNNQRHGEGNMKWPKLGQLYVGTWENGLQHGRGTHTWFHRRTNGSQYPQRNEYRGEFVGGQRHGHGTFHYAGGALYDGQWKDDKKHGQGKFIFKNGHSFEAEFSYGQMVSPDLWGNGDHTPRGAFPLRAPDTLASTLGHDMALDIESVLANIPERQQEAERRQVELMVLRNNTVLRSIYSFYSRLGHARSPDNTFVLSRLQLWRFLKDCNVHHHGISLTRIDRLIKVCSEEDASAETRSLFTAVLLCKFLSGLVVVAYHIYHKDTESKFILASCFAKLMADNILPNANKVKGFLFSQPAHTAVALSFFERSWEVYQVHCRVSEAPSADRTMTYRHLLWLFKDFCLFDSSLTIAKLIRIMTAEGRDPNNLSLCLDQEITFMEFFEVLLGSAEVKCQQEVEGQKSQSRSDPETRGGLPDGEDGESDTHTASCVSLQVEAPVNSADTPESSTTKEEEELNSGDAVQMSTRKDRESLQKLNSSVESYFEEKCVEDRGRGLELWTQRIQAFFRGLFFPRFDHRQLVSKNMKEWRIRQETERRGSLDKEEEEAREQREEEEDDDEEDEEDEDGEEGSEAEDSTDLQDKAASVQSNTVESGD
ncbi:radial spoke head 10 homolog B [Genypterus blacodes]|uniref:radial spoke head 10 homolog B n=1 Tax=Genypterus blacodes TaxID=154954 RepID=UPI003F771D54